jgi:hypothetical protein
MQVTSPGPVSLFCHPVTAYRCLIGFAHDFLNLHPDDIDKLWIHAIVSKIPIHNR